MDDGRFEALVGDVGGECGRHRRASTEERFARREVLGLGGAVLVALAGCTDAGDGDSDAEGSSGGPSFVVREAAVSETAIYTEDAIEITGTIENTGEADGTFHAQLRVDSVIVETQSVAVGAGETESVSFTGSFGDPGEYEITINDEPAGSVRVERPPPEFELVDATIEETTVAVGEAVEVRATIANVGGREGTHAARLAADGRAVATEEVTIEAGTEEAVVLTHAFDVPGRYGLALDDIEIGVVTVERPAAFEIVDTAIDENVVVVGETIGTAVRIENVGGQVGTVAAILEDGDEPLATREGGIEPGETATARFAVEFDTAGRYPLEVEIRNRDPVGDQPGVTERRAIETVYVRECTPAVRETIAVDSGSSQTYVFELNEYDGLEIATTTQSGVEPALSVTGPTETLVEESGDPIERSVIADERGRHELRLENEALLPWRDGTWEIEIVVCRW